MSFENPSENSGDAKKTPEKIKIVGRGSIEDLVKEGDPELSKIVDYDEGDYKAAAEEILGDEYDYAKVAFMYEGQIYKVDLPLHNKIAERAAERAKEHDLIAEKIKEERKLNEEPYSI